MRRKLDFYPTPEWATKLLLESVSISGHILEPCVGQGHMADVLEQAGHTVTTNDIDESTEADFHVDARTPELWNKVAPDWTITNPPYSDAMAVLRQAESGSRKGVALLLRLSFLEPTIKRRDFLLLKPPTRLIVLPRISFTGDGKTDSVTVAWMIWERSAQGSIEVAYTRRPLQGSEKPNRGP